MMEALKEEIIKFLKGIHGNKNKQWKEINKPLQDPKVEIESIKKT